MSSNRKLKPSSPPALPLKWALGLAAGVTLAHLWLLGSVSRPMSVEAAAPSSAPSAAPPVPGANASMRTRRIDPAPRKAAAPVASTSLSLIPPMPPQRASNSSPSVSPAPPATPAPALAVEPAPSVQAAEPTPSVQAAAPAPSVQAAEPAPSALAEEPTPSVQAAAPQAEAETEAQIEADATVQAAPSPSPQPAPPLPANLPPPEAAQAPAPLDQTATLQAPPPPDTPKLQLPGSVRLQYELSGQSRGLNYSAKAQLSWHNEGTRYEARLLISGLLILTPRLSVSVGELGLQGVAPRRFSDKARSEQATHFQPERGRIVFSNNAPEAPWQTGVQDRLSLFFQLAGMLAGDPERYLPGTQVRVPTTGTREVDTWTFTVTGTPTLALPYGEQATLALRREPRRAYDQTIEIWFAPGLNFVPVRMRITQGNGDVLDQNLASVQAW